MKKKAYSKTSSAESRKKTASTKNRTQGQLQDSSPERTESRSATQAGDLQGLRKREGADSEGVDELVEEGNAFEAEVVEGVEEADEDQEREVTTHEVSEDDVPEEYLDKD